MRPRPAFPAAFVFATAVAAGPNAPFACQDKVFMGDYVGLAAQGGRVVAVYTHVLDESETALSAAVLRFKTGTQEAAR